MIKHESGEKIREARLNIDTKLRALEGTARILSENYGVQVVFSEDGECKTSLERMTLPYDEAIDEALIFSLMGHEVGHLMATDFDVARTIARMRETSHRELLFNICNCLEDVRIEDIMETKYIGFKSMFKRMVPYIQERKVPLIELEELRAELKVQGKTPEAIEKVIKKKNEKDLIDLREKLSKDYTDKLVDQLVESESKRREHGHISELQKIMDLIYLKLRGYHFDFYPVDVNAFVDDYIMDTAKEVLTCKSTAEVLVVAEKVYEILTNEKKTQVDNDKKRQEMIKQGKGKGKGKGSGSGSGSGGRASKEDVKKANEEAREREEKAQAERMKKRAEGADVEDFVKNKQGQEGQEGQGSQGSQSKKFTVGQSVGSLDHECKGEIVVADYDKRGDLTKLEIDWKK